MSRSDPCTENNYLITAQGLFVTASCEQDQLIAPNTDQVICCRKWIQVNCKRQSAVNKDFDSYSLKHYVERQARTYVSNGAFIQAARELGYKVRAIGKTNPNAVFNMKVLLPANEWQRVRPTGFSKWLFHQREEDTWVGDLARDAFEDPAWPRKAKRFIDFYLYLDETRRACEGALGALEAAWKQRYNETPPYVNEEIRRKCEQFYDNECDVIHFKDSYRTADKGKTFIYVLFETKPIMGAGGVQCDRTRVRYVGQSVEPAKRLTQHVLCPGSKKRVIWVAEHLKKHQYPCMAIVDIVDKCNATYAETVFIMAFGDREREDGQAITEVLLNEYLVY